MELFQIKQLSCNTFLFSNLYSMTELHIVFFAVFPMRPGGYGTASLRLFLRGGSPVGICIHDFIVITNYTLPLITGS